MGRVRTINRLKELRKAAGLGQAEVAERLDVTQSAVSKWEHGCIPLAKYRRKLAKLYGVAEEELKRWLEDGKRA